MSGESVVAIAYRDGRVHFIDMQSAQERPMVLIGHAASIRCMVVQEDRKRIFTVSIWRSSWVSEGGEDRTCSREVTIWRFVVGVWKQVAAWNCIKATNEQWRVWLCSWIWLQLEEMTIYVWVKKWTDIQEFFDTKENIYLVWRSRFTRPWRTFKHKHPVSAVAINDVMTLSGDVHGKIKVWHILTGQLLKVIRSSTAESTGASRSMI